MLTAVAGINWGDEGKGRMTDVLSEGQDVVCRYQGGNNAGHTIMNDRGRYVLNLLPSGILRDKVVNVLGPGMVLDLAHLAGEIRTLREQGLEITPMNLKVSDRACICLPYHVSQDIWEEDRLGDRRYGTTRKGISPAYGDKYMKKILRMSDLFSPDALRDKVKDLLEWKHLLLDNYEGKLPMVRDLIVWLTEYGEIVKPFVTNTTSYLSDAIDAGKRILFETQLGALRDIDYGIYPYTTSSCTLSAYATTGAGIPWARLDKVIGVMKAYSSCVGEGPFTAELFGLQAEILQEPGSQFGVATARPRRVGAFDIPASRYGVKIQGADELALTKLDILEGMAKIPVCVAYEIDGNHTEDFPAGDMLLRAKPVFDYLEGFSMPEGKHISQCRSRHDLPKEAQAYIEYIEKAVSCPITYVSLGPDRDDYINWREK
ncbi:MAG: adenylosuccinate synthase [Defluviitaleaceae bacterium]|nr:adenylosuccinate synthase [Defluviitaleaceae bacterium]